MADLIPLYSLRAFEAAARQSSFLKAALELHITPAAVAHQIRRLEEDLGVELFIRLHKGVRLNENGKAFLLSVERAFDELRRGRDSLLTHENKTIVRVVALHGFIEKWLFPRLKTLQLQHPHLRIELRASETDENLGIIEDDIWISHTVDPPSPGHSEFLFSTWMTPVCSPKTLQTADPDIHSLLATQPRLYDTFWRNDWKVWSEQFGGKPLSLHESLGFNLYNMVIQAAVNGMGLAIGHDALIEDEIARGQLVRPFDYNCRCGKSYFVTTKTGHIHYNSNVFLTWLREEGRKQRDRSINVLKER